MKQFFSKKLPVVAAATLTGVSLVFTAGGCGGGSDAPSAGGSDSDQADTPGVEPAENADQFDASTPVGAVMMFAQFMAEADFMGAASITNTVSPERATLEMLHEQLDGIANNPSAEPQAKALVPLLRDAYAMPYRNVETELVEINDESGTATVNVTLRNTAGDLIKQIDGATLTKFVVDGEDTWLLTLTEEFVNAADFGSISMPEPSTSSDDAGSEPAGLQPTAIPPAGGG